MPIIKANSGVITQINAFTVLEGGQQPLIDLLAESARFARDVPGWDSFRMVEIVVGSEDHFGIELDARDVDRFNCVGDMVEAIVDRLRIPDRSVP